jgi:hypothetical protein
MMATWAAVMALPQKRQSGASYHCSTRSVKTGERRGRPRPIGAAAGGPAFVGLSPDGGTAPV